MQRYGMDENLDEYEDDVEDGYEDQYEDEEEEDEEEEEKEEPMSEEAIRYLNIREKLKAKHRSILRRENGKNGASINQSKLSNFGSFFGPSKPVIADRVIQESKSFMETRHLAPKVSTSQKDVKKVSMSSTTASKIGPSDRPLPRQVNSKSQIMKQTRDYSFLLSDDTEIPKLAKDPGSHKSVAPKPGLEDTRSAQDRAKRYEPSSHSGKKGYDRGELRKPSSGNSQVRDDCSAPSQKSTSGNRASLPSSDSRRQLELRKQPLPHKVPSSSNGSGSRPALQKGVPSQKPLSSNDRRMPVGSMQKKPYAATVGNKASAVAKTSTLDRQRMPMVKPQASSSYSRSEHKRDIQQSTERKTLKKENVAASKYQMKTPKQGSLQSSLEKAHHIKNQKPTGQLQNRSAAHNKDHKIKKRKAPDSDSECDVSSVIRSLFRRPKQYHVDDSDDDSMMEAGFDDIMQEEKRSARIAKKEDDEEFIKIQEEERQERLRKKAKMGKKMTQR